MLLPGFAGAVATGVAAGFVADVASVVAVVAAATIDVADFAVAVLLPRIFRCRWFSRYCSRRNHVAVADALAFDNFAVDIAVATALAVIVLSLLLLLLLLLRLIVSLSMVPLLPRSL